MVIINDGTSTQWYCDSTPGTVTGTIVTVKLYTRSSEKKSGFFAVVTGDVTVTTDVTGKFSKCIKY